MLLGFFSPCYAQETTFRDWINPRESVYVNWTIVPDEKDPLRISIRPRDSQQSTEGRKILFLFPKKSSAYDTALSKILDVFADKGIFADVMVVNFKGKPELGRAALQYAKMVDFDLIYSMGSATTTYLVKHFKNEMSAQRILS